MSARMDAQPRVTLGRVVTVVLGVALIVCVVVLGVVAYHGVLADRAHDAPVSADVRAAFAEASRDWIRHVDVPVRRVVLTSAEEYGSGNFIFVFDAYTWFGVGSGFVTSGGVESSLTGGGLLRDGGFAGLSQHEAPEGLEETRAVWRDAYGPGRDRVSRR